MRDPFSKNAPPGRPARGIQSIDVERTADALLRAGKRPTVEKVRAKLGTGSPNTINPLLDQWWQRLSDRLEAGPRALDRLPESVIHAAETLWHTCLDQARSSAKAELRVKESTFDSKQSEQDARAEVLRHREQELVGRLADRDRTLSILESDTKAFVSLYKREQAKSAAETRRIVVLQGELESLRKLLASLSIRTVLKQRSIKSGSIAKPAKVAAKSRTTITKRKASRLKVNAKAQRPSRTR